MIYDTIIVGGGVSGLVSGNLLAKMGHKVLILERHNILGGCASYFRRGNFVFDVGATTLSGVKFNGPLKRLIEDLELNLPLVSLNPSMKIHMKGQEFNVSNDKIEWINELKKIAPEADLLQLQNKLELLSESLWKTTKLGESYPPRSWREIKDFWSFSTLKALKLLPYFSQNFEKALSNQLKKSPEFIQLIDQLLLISTQAKSHQVSMAIGSLGLTYPNDMYYLQGGLRTLIESLAHQFEGDIELSSQVCSIHKKNKHFEVCTKNAQFKSNNIVMALPIWNIPELISEENLKKHFFNLSKKFVPTWSAISAYFAVKYKKPISPLYHQVHLTKELHQKLGESLFLSFSKEDDLSRQEEGFQTVTVSGHWPFSMEIPLRGSAEYKLWKRDLAENITFIFNETFKSFGPFEFKYFEVGTPKTFERYTGRFGGTVGGISMSLENSIFSFPQHQTCDSNFYHVGDTTFPGQGIVGVITGAYGLCSKIGPKS